MGNFLFYQRLPWLSTFVWALVVVVHSILNNDSDKLVVVQGGCNGSSTPPVGFVQSAFHHFGASKRLPNQNWLRKDPHSSFLITGEHPNGVHHDASSVDKDELSSPKVTGVTLKIAVDAQNGVADLGAKISDRFTCGMSLDMVHRLRFRSDAVLVGKGTVRADDPSLTIRRGELLPTSSREQPLRVILDPTLSLLEDKKKYRIFQDDVRTVLYHCVAPPENAVVESWIANPNLDFVSLPSSSREDKKFFLSPLVILSDLSQRYSIHHLMIEGGPSTARTFLQDGLVDRLILVRATTVRFKEPLFSELTDDLLKQAGLQQVGSYQLEEVDDVECWTRKGGPWPSTDMTTTDLSLWP